MPDIRPLTMVLSSKGSQGQGRGRVWIGISIVALLLGGLGFTPPSSAAEFSCAAGDVACLIDAINQANANGEANTITLEAGTYTLTAVDNTTDGPNGLPPVISPLTIQGAGVDTTLVERDASAPPFRLMHVAATGLLTLEGLTLRGGGGLGAPGSAVLEGGGLFNRGTVTLTHSALTDNGALGNGAGLLNWDGTVAVANSLIAHNALMQPGFGGGIYNRRGTVTIAATMIVQNGAQEGGGVSNGGAGPNEAGTITLTHTTLARNFGFSGGGGLNNASPGTVLLTHSTVADNGTSAGSGAGIANFSTVLLIDSTLARNQSGDEGGGLGNFIGGTAILTNTTVADNSALAGGGLASVSVPGQPPSHTVLVNTILARNTARFPGEPPDCAALVTSLGTNLVGDPTRCTITLLPTDLTGDPGLGEFTDDGTPGNGHFPLLPGSPAIDAGNDAACPPTDQLGQPRVLVDPSHRAVCDIGAIEFQLNTF